VLADFVAKWIETQMPSALADQEYWTMYFDRSLMKKEVGVGLVLISLLRVCLRYIVHLHFPASNNVAEYEALINDLHIAIEMRIR
jgi:ribonuclease HI